MTVRTTTARTNELLTQAHDLAGGASHVVANAASHTASLVTDAAAAVAGSAAHVLESLGSTIEHTIDQAKSLSPRRRRSTRRARLSLVLVLAGMAVFVIARRRRSAGPVDTSSDRSAVDSAPAGRDMADTAGSTAPSTTSNAASDAA